MVRICETQEGLEGHREWPWLEFVGLRRSYRRPHFLCFLYYRVKGLSLIDCLAGRTLRNDSNPIQF